MKLFGSWKLYVKFPLSSLVTLPVFDHVLPMLSSVCTTIASCAGQPVPVIVTVSPGA